MLINQFLNSLGCVNHNSTHSAFGKAGITASKVKADNKITNGNVQLGPKIKPQAEQSFKLQIGHCGHIQDKKINV